jgi:hypothetical protein
VRVLWGGRGEVYSFGFDRVRHFSLLRHPLTSLRRFYVRSLTKSHLTTGEFNRKCIGDPFTPIHQISQVFKPHVTQSDRFAEISQLAQSCTDGHMRIYIRVCTDGEREDYDEMWGGELGVFFYCSGFLQRGRFSFSFC